MNAAFDMAANVGIPRYIRSLSTELARLCELTVLTAHPELFRPPISTVRIPDWAAGRNKRVLWTVACLSLRQLPRQDVLLCPTPAVPLRWDIPKIAVVHDLTPLVLARHHDSLEKTAFWVGLLSLPTADSIVTDSRNTMKDLLSHVPRVRGIPGYVVYPGVGLSGEQACSRLSASFGSYILSVGSHAPHKNMSRLVAAFARLRGNPNRHLVIVGSGNPRHVARTRGIAAAHGVANRVTLLRDVSERDLAGLYRACELFVFPSVYEGYGLPVHEAMICGAPVACSNSSSLPEVAGAAAHYFDPESVSSMAACMQQLLDDPARREALSERGRKRARQFSWESMARMILHIAEETLRRPRLAPRTRRRTARSAEELL